MLANGLRALWRYRGLVRRLVQRDLQLKYKGSVVGFGWSLMHPLLLVVVYSIAFRLVLRVEVEQFPFFLVTGLLPWSFHAASLASATGSVVDAGHLVRKVDFPRVALPLGAVLTQWAQFVLMYATVVVIIGLLGVGFAPATLLIVPLAVLQLGFSIGLGALLSAAHVHFRDVRHLVEVGVQLWFWATPVVYPVDLVPSWLMPVVRANPMALFVTAYQHAVMRHESVSAVEWLALVGVSAAMLGLGLTTFQRHERRFAELV
jgi:ABC-type polysaccharide/polyol phosphate export permease